MLLLISRRTRVLVMCNGEVLLAKSWLGNGQWHLLGGGLKRGENPAQGACRELHEEIGLHVEPTDLTFIHRAWTPKDHRFRYRYFAYALELEEKPDLVIDTHEIAEVTWKKFSELDAHATGGVRQVWAAWKNMG